MNRLRTAPDLALVVPFHNEQRFLPSLVKSLREQSVHNVPVVFVDNGSTDGSHALIQDCREIRAGKWICIKTRTIGKVHAMKTATAFCAQRLGVRNVGFVDADSYLGDSQWVHHSLEIIDGAGGGLGYTYSPFVYFGFDELPVFRSAYLAYERVLRFLLKNIGWLANGLGFVCSSEVLNKYFREAEVTTEIDLRCSLLALSLGRKGYLNPGLLVTSGRRMIANAKNFAAWCFYKREFYSKKDINTRNKIILDAPATVQDLPPDKVEQFFRRRAMKITCRHLIPLAIFDESSYTLERIREVLGMDLAAKLNRTTRGFRGNTRYLLTDEFESMIRAIERDPATLTLAKDLEGLMLERYREAACLMKDSGRRDSAAKIRAQRGISLNGRDIWRREGTTRQIAQIHLQLYKQLRRQERSEKDLAMIHQAYQSAVTRTPDNFVVDRK